MNKNIYEGKWKEMRGQVKEWWGKLTDDDLDQAAGNAEQIVACSNKSTAILASAPNKNSTDG